MVVKHRRIEEIFAALGRLSQREKYILGGVAISFVLFVGLLTTMLVSSSLNRIEQRITTKTLRLQEIQKLSHQYANAKAAQDQATRDIEQGRHIQLMGTLENLATQIGINTKELEMNPRGSTTDPESSIEEKRVEVTIPKITIDRLVEFLEKAEKRSKCIKIQTLQIKKNFKEPTKLDAEFSVSKYEKKLDKAGASSSAGAPNPK